MTSKEYIFNHNFGYGKDEEEKINKLMLRNLEDLKVYIKWFLQKILSARVSRKNVVQFWNSTIKTQVTIEEIY